MAVSSTTNSKMGEVNRMAGMMSGLDTESLVKASTSNTKIAINNKKKKLQTLTWKQEGYRDVIQKLSDFKDKYLDILSASSIKSNSNMNKYVAKSSNDKLSVYASSSSGSSEYTLSAATRATSAKIESSGSSAAGAIKLDFSAAGETNTVDVTLDGTTKSITFAGGEDAKQNFLSAVNETFGNISNASFDFDGDALVVRNGEGDSVMHSFAVGADDSVGLVNTTTSQIKSSATLGSVMFAQELKGDMFEFSINGKDFSFDRDSKISDIISTVNKSDAGVKLSFSGLSQSFTLESTSTGAGQSIEISQTSGNLLNAMFNRTSEELYDPESGSAADAPRSLAAYGSNATVTINGVTVESASNAFTIDGTTFDISKLDSVDEPITVTTAHDTSSIKETVVNFIKDYNELIKGLHETVTTSRPKSKGSYYDPLTEEQEEEMKDEEIEKWNEKAKEGLLYNDPTIVRAANDIKLSIMGSVNGMTLSDLGIKIKSGSEFNELEVDESALEAAIGKWGDDVSNFFTDTEKGLAHRMEEAFDKAISTKSNKYGTLTSLAGVKNTVSEKKNQMYSQMNSLQTMIDSLTKRYENQQELLWTRYSRLESYISKMSAQSSVFGSY